MKYDAVVVGAGPAGSFCALNLAKKGIKVLMIDKCIFPREKACGGLLSQKSINTLERHIVSVDINYNCINGICLHGENDEKIITNNDSPLGIVVNRMEFDQFLANKAVEAGVIFIENCKFENYASEAGTYKIKTTKGNFYANYLIGADGYYSKVARASNIRNRWSKWEQGMALYAKVPDKYILQERGNTVEFYFLDVLAGLGWCFPGNGYYNIGVGGTVLDRRQIQIAFKSLLEEKIKDKNIISDLKREAGFMAAGGRLRKISDRRIFLLGDAAGFVDAFSGEGIYYALRSAQILAEVISQDSDGREYEKRCYEAFLREFRLSAFLSIYYGDKRRIFKKGLQNEFLKSFRLIMTQTPENMCYKKIFQNLKLRGFSFQLPLVWLKRLILDWDEKHPTVIN